MLRNFEDYLDKSNQCKTSEELFSVYLEAVKKHGLDKALFALISDDRDISQRPGIGILHNFSADWMQHYFERGFDKIDPVPIYGANQVGAYTWDDVFKNMQITREQENILHGGIESGLNNGVSTYLRGANNQIAGVSLASSEKKDSFDGRTDLITAYSNHFYIKYREINKVPQSVPENILLSKREKEVLLWLANDKTNEEIGMIIGITKHTVDHHLRNIFQKLGVNGRLLCVVKALSLGLIER